MLNNVIKTADVVFPPPLGGFCCDSRRSLRSHSDHQLCFCSRGNNTGVFKSEEQLDSHQEVKYEPKLLSSPD